MTTDAARTKFIDDLVATLSTELTNPGHDGLIERPILVVHKPHSSAWTYAAYKSVEEATEYHRGLRGQQPFGLNDHPQSGAFMISRYRIADDLSFPKRRAPQMPHDYS